MPQVSVIVPAYNSAAFIRETIGSVVAQTFSDWELLVVNDGSTDDTKHVVSGIDARVICIDRDNGGIAAARNTGLSLARGQFVAFLDHDDYWHPEKLAAQLSAAQTHDEYGVFYGEFRQWDPIEVPSFADEHLNPGFIDERLSGWIYHLLLLTNWVLFSTALFRRKVFEEVGMFDPELPPADDWDLAVRASRKFKFLKLAQPVVLYRQHGAQTSRRVTAKDHEVEFRRRTIDRFGLIGPNGAEVDRVELRTRQFRAHFRHGTLHLRQGDPAIAALALRDALRLNPRSAKAWLYYLASRGRSVAQFARRSTRLG